MKITLFIGAKKGVPSKMSSFSSPIWVVHSSLFLQCLVSCWRTPTNQSFEIVGVENVFVRTWVFTCFCLSTLFEMTAPSTWIAVEIAFFLALVLSCFRSKALSLVVIFKFAIRFKVTRFFKIFYPILI